MMSDALSITKYRFRRRKQCVQRFLNRTQICSDQANDPNKSPACSIYPRTLLSTRLNMCSGQNNNQTLGRARGQFVIPVNITVFAAKHAAAKKRTQQYCSLHQFALLLHVGVSDVAHKWRQLSQRIRHHRPCSSPLTVGTPWIC